MANARKMHTDLMRAAGSDSHFEQTEAADLLDGAVFGEGRAAGFKTGGHARAPHGIARDGPADDPLRGRRVAMHEGQIDLLHLAGLKLGGQGLVRRVVAGHDQNTAGIFIQPVNNAGPQISTNSRRDPKWCNSALTRVPC